MRALRTPVTLEQRRRQRFWENVRQLALMSALAAAFAVGLVLGAQRSVGTEQSTQHSSAEVAATLPLKG